MIKINSHNYPAEIKDHFFDYPELTAIGNLSLISDETIGLLCSRKCPGSVILQVFDLIAKWRKMDLTLISGFHSPLEQEIFKSLFKSRAKFIVCPARSIEKMRIKKDFQDLIEQKRLLIISPFTKNENRLSSALARQRNAFVSRLAARTLIINASANSQTEKLAGEIGQFWTLDNPANENLFKLGASVWK